MQQQALSASSTSPSGPSGWTVTVPRGAAPMTKSWVVLAVLALCCGVGLFAAGSVHAQSSYPSQPVRLMVPYAPGGLPDTVARIAGQRLQDRFGQSVVVENRPGGN